MKKIQNIQVDVSSCAFVNYQSIFLNNSIYIVRFDLGGKRKFQSVYLYMDGVMHFQWFSKRQKDELISLTDREKVSFAILKVRERMEIEALKIAKGGDVK